MYPKEKGMKLVEVSKITTSCPFVTARALHRPVELWRQARHTPIRPSITRESMHPPVFSNVRQVVVVTGLLQ
eukprot:1147132-Pelagomonas_calceolata.AAC.3